MNLFRLVKGGKVAGGELHEHSTIYHCDRIDLLFAEFEHLQLFDIILRPEAFIRYDRKDMFTGITLDDGTKVFQRDWVMVKGEEYLVKFCNGSWSLVRDAVRSTVIWDLYRNVKYIKVTGIQGVTS